MDILIGTDPEMFVYDDTLGHIVSAHPYVPGTKQQPFLVPDGAVQLDGVAAEFNIFPASTAEEFVRKIRFVQSNLIDIIRELAEGDGHPDPSALRLVAHPTAHFKLDYFESLPQSVKVLGCQPDYNAWTETMQQPSASGTDKTAPFRTGGFHIHVGWTKEASISTRKPHFYDAMKMAKQLDCVIFPVSLLWDNDDKRRELYGSRGSFRPKHYGMEYRSLSNACLNDDELLAWLFDASKKAAELLFDEDYLFENEVIHPDAGLICDPVEYMYLIHEDYDIPLLPKKYLKIAKAA